MQVTDYKILTSGNNTTSMEENVKREIANGFQPYGDLQVVVASSGPISLFQVMVKGEGPVGQGVYQQKAHR